MSVRRTVGITCQIADMDLRLRLLGAISASSELVPGAVRCRVSPGVIIILPETGGHPKILG
jgi:hypothetical protein